MTLNRLRIALNSNDYGIVTKGLVDFTNYILDENNAVLSFGYKGRSYVDKPQVQRKSTWEVDIETLFPSFDIEVLAKGDLKQLIDSSPQLEEFFQLWDLPGRNDDKILCAEHMTCLAAILHCSRSHATFCSTIVNRILHGYLRSIYNQLASNSPALIHATLGLLVSIVRISPGMGRDLYQKIQLTHDSFLSLISRSRSISWSPDVKYIKHPSIKFSTDSKYLLVLLVLSILRISNQETIHELLGRDSIYKKLIASLHKDSRDVIRLLLIGLKYIQRDDYCLALPSKSLLIDDYFQNKLLTLLNSPQSVLAEGETANIQVIKEASYSLLSDFIKHIVPHTAMRRGTVNRGRFIALKLIKSLQGHTDVKQRQVRALAMSLKAI